MDYTKNGYNRGFYDALNGKSKNHENIPLESGDNLEKSTKEWKEGYENGYAEGLKKKTKIGDDSKNSCKEG